MIKIILIGLLWPFCVFAGEMEDNNRAMRKLAEGKKQYINNQRDQYRRDLARYEKNRKTYLENPTLEEWKKQSVEYKRLKAEHKKLYPKARVYMGSSAGPVIGKGDPKIWIHKNRVVVDGGGGGPGYVSVPKDRVVTDVGGGGLAFDSVPITITTKAGVKAQRFQGVLFEANPSGEGMGSIGCEIDKKTGKKICRGGCWSKIYRRIDEKTGNVISHYHKPKRHTASGSVR